MSGYEHIIDDGTDRIRIVQQYAKLPQHGLVVRVEHRTTGAGRAVLLRPDQVRELAEVLTLWTELTRIAAPSAVPPTTPADEDYDNSSVERLDDEYGIDVCPECGREGAQCCAAPASPVGPDQTEKPR